MKIAIIGSGISGLSAAYMLHSGHDITVYEKNAYIGGHSRTVDVTTPEGVIAVDTGFIVFNHRNYPLLTGLFRHLGVETTKSDMSFGASISDAWLEYATQGLSNLFAQKRNLLNPAFLGMLRDIFRFNKYAPAYLDDPRQLTLGQVLDELKLGSYFRHYYILAVGGAIWSCPLEQMLAFPANTFIRFFVNHGLLTINDQPQWYTVTGGSRAYVQKLTAPFREKIRLNCGVKSVERGETGIAITDASGEQSLFDHVIFACHSDQALRLLDRPSAEEQSLLGAIAYQPNSMVLHSDTSFMPKCKGAWASWVYLSESRRDQNPRVSLSYWMNNLQPLPTSTPLIVTLNPARQPDPALVHDSYTFEHPVFDTAAVGAQPRFAAIQGQHNTWYCGAYHRYGFHEDGLMSGVAVAEALGAARPWR